METTLIIVAMKKKIKSDPEKEFVFSVLKSESGSRVSLCLNMSKMNTYLTMMSLEPIVHNNDMVHYNGPPATQGHRYDIPLPSLTE